MKRSASIALALVVGLLLVPAVASAEWGLGCSYGGKEENHCYAVAAWEMSGSGNGGGEEVKGLSSEILTTIMEVPNWKSGAFVTNEQWAGFENTGGWVEDGHIAGSNYPTEEGHEVNDDSLHWFYAHAYPSGFELYIAPWTFEGWKWLSYTLSDPSSNGEWCIKIGTVQVQCYSGFPKYATSVEVGAENADSTQPSDSGKDRTGVQHVNGDWYAWNKAWWWESHYGAAKSEKEHEKAYLCVTGYEDVAGNINFASPNNACGYE